MAFPAASISCICLAGPTASGKSALALALARQVGGAVVNADSMQVYRDLRVLTARPGEAESGSVPHRLYGHVDAAERYSAGRFIEEAGPVLAGLAAEGLVPVVTGGTGLYFRGLLAGFSPIPPVPEAVLARWRARLMAEGPEALHRLLAERDPALAGRLPAGDSQRILRGLSVLEATGRPLSAWQSEPGTPLVDPARALLLKDTA